MKSLSGEVKIKTPYGNKNWSYVKRVFDTHDELLEACKEIVKYMKNETNNPAFVYDRVKQAIAKAEGK